MVLYFEKLNIEMNSVEALLLFIFYYFNQGLQD